MNIIQLTENKKQHIDLLLLADEQESMIDIWSAETCSCLMMAE